MCMAISATVSAKGSSHVQDGDESKAIGSCMVKVDDALEDFAYKVNNCGKKN